MCIFFKQQEISLYSKATNGLPPVLFCFVLRWYKENKPNFYIVTFGEMYSLHVVNFRLRDKTKLVLLLPETCWEMQCLGSCHTKCGASISFQHQRLSGS